MHARFNLDPARKDWREYFGEGKRIYNEYKANVVKDLKRFESPRGILQAKDIIENWFPAIDADVFLSHSHKDEPLIIGLAGWLHKEFGLKPFIDSTVWGYSDELLRVIDNECDQYKKYETYNYYRRNRSTSHVHMMLSTALMDMMDRCECLIFVNTPNSFIPNDYLMSQGETESPWIYSEIAMTRMLRQKPPKEHRAKAVYDGVNASLEHIKEANELRVAYPLDTLHLTPLTLSDLDHWMSRKRTDTRNTNPLDILYEMKASKGVIVG
ncbi:hypothetical protein EV700_0928 [Fluviicoccus keumensis]|uniref:TIR domain-containing protein n=1 Tax=Fluviicoccus keumensis TaxID=1435465 RepID=A0A4Q7ZDI9_9GAMM|nr:hypothetical protein [Fluviicoccus keumensis]RZU47959.1 hypothetical protein EV700_0928 [Fluviicoccus keumensis]